VDETLCAVCETHERTAHSLVAGWTFLHTKSIAAMGNSRENGTVKLYFPWHIAHKMQSHDVRFIRSLGEFYNRYTKAWFSNNPERKVP
jgi:hypothetical protein